MLKSCGVPLASAYDLALLDLDGVVYIGVEAVVGAPAHLEAARAAGMRLAFVTNNAARPPRDVGAHLRELGIHAPDSEVVTSAQAAARVLAEMLEPGSKVFVVGGVGLMEALEDCRLVPVGSIDDEPQAVVSGYHPDLEWSRIRDGGILVARGLPWVASNADATVPTPNGPGPGNGAAVDVIANFTGRSPILAGKPEPPLFHESVARVGGEHPLVVGDRLDTDIEGARKAGFDSLLVMTGVTGLAELVCARGHERPDYISSDLAGLLRPHRAPSEHRTGWTARVESDGQMSVAGGGSADEWWAVVAQTAWTWFDETGHPVKTSQLTIPGSV